MVRDLLVAEPPVPFFAVHEGFDLVPPLLSRRTLIGEPGQFPAQHEALEALLPKIPVSGHCPRELLPQLVQEDLQRETLVNPVSK
jgi:hypothetical protein